MRAAVLIRHPRQRDGTRCGARRHRSGGRLSTSIGCSAITSPSVPIPRRCSIGCTRSSNAIFTRGNTDRYVVEGPPTPLSRGGAGGMRARTPGP